MHRTAVTREVSQEATARPSSFATRYCGSCCERLIESGVGSAGYRTLAYSSPEPVHNRDRRSLPQVSEAPCKAPFRGYEEIDLSLLRSEEACY
jgi:hypothetical protein